MPTNSQAAAEATRHLRLALAFLNEFDEDAPKPEAGRTRLRDILQSAFRNIAEARRQDASAVLTTEDSGRTLTYTLDTLEGMYYGREGRFHRLWPDYPGSKENARAAYEKAVRHFPIASYHYLLALSQVDTYDRKGAIANARRAVELEPDDIDYAKFLDRITNNPSLGAEPPFIEHYNGTLLFGGMGIVLLAIVLGFTYSFVGALWLGALGVIITWLGGKGQDWEARRRVRAQMEREGRL
jgi:hypothetical protein